MHRQCSTAGTDCSTDLAAGSKAPPRTDEEAEPRLDLCLSLIMSVPIELSRGRKEESRVAKCSVTRSSLNVSW